MAKVRQPGDRVLPPLPSDSPLVQGLREHVGDAPDAVYELRPFPPSGRADEALLQHKMAEKEVAGWPVIQRPEAALAPLREFFAEGLQLRPYSVSFRCKGDPGVSIAFPFFFFKNLHELGAGGW